MLLKVSGFHQHHKSTEINQSPCLHRNKQTHAIPPASLFLCFTNSELIQLMGKMEKKTAPLKKEKEKKKGKKEGRKAGRQAGRKEGETGSWEERPD